MHCIICPTQSRTHALTPGCTVLRPGLPSAKHSTSAAANSSSSRQQQQQQQTAAANSSSSFSLAMVAPAHTPQQQHARTCMYVTFHCTELLGIQLAVGSGAGRQVAQLRPSAAVRACNDSSSSRALPPSEPCCVSVLSKAPAGSADPRAAASAARAPLPLIVPVHTNSRYNRGLPLPQQAHGHAPSPASHCVQ